MDDDFSQRGIERSVKQIMDRADEINAQRANKGRVNYDACELMAAITESHVPIKALDDEKLRMLIDTYGVREVTETLVAVYGAEDFVFYFEPAGPDEPRH